MKNYVIGIGEVLWDVLPDGKKLGGAPANFAYHASQFGFNTLAVSAIGDDALGDETCETLDGKGLNYLLPRVPYPTGTVQVSLDAQGVPAYDIKEGVAWDNIPFSPEIEEIAKNAKAVCFGTLAQRNAVSRATIRRFLNATPQDCVRIFDINLRQNFYTKEIINDSLELCNILKINDEELVLIGNMFGFPSPATSDAQSTCQAILHKFNLDTVILTCGVNGSYIFTSDKAYYQPTPKVEVADTVGAGDSFTGSFCAAILHGVPVEKAHSLAVKVSAFVCTQNGAMPQYPAALLTQL